MKNFKTKNGFFTGNVGIGTASPSSKLQIHSDTAVSQTFAVTTLLGANAISHASMGHGANKIGNVQLSNASGNLKVFLTSEGDSYLIGGNVGIGTSNPDALLEVISSSNVVTGGGDPVAIRIGHSNQDGGLNSYSIVDDVCQLQFYSADASHVSGDGGVRASVGIISESVAGGAMALTFGIDDEERVRVTSTGNVGIGTTNPGNILNIYDSAAGSAGTSANPDWSDSLFLQRNIPNNYQGTRILFAHGKASIGGFREDYTEDGSHHLAFYTGSNLSGVSEAMRIDSTGNVGIGTTSPGAKLHVNGSIYLSEASNLLFLSQNGFSPKINNSTNDQELSVLTDNQVRLHVASNGNVGIGTTSPGAKLHVNGSVRFDGNLMLNTAGNTPYVIGGTISTVFRNNANDTSNLTITDAGSIGIGTAEPGSYRLNVTNANADFAQKISNSNSTSAYCLYLEIPGGHDDKTSEFIRCMTGNGNINFRVYSDGTMLSNGSSLGSDDRIKHNEEEIVNAVETLSKITPKKYFKTTKLYDANHDFDLNSNGNPIDENGETVSCVIEAGVIAQEVLGVDELKFAVSPEAKDEDGNVTTPYALNYNSLFTYAIAAIQEQQQLIESQKQLIESQQSTVDDLISRVESLES